LIEKAAKLIMEVSFLGGREATELAYKLLKIKPNTGWDLCLGIKTGF